jgi:hypothetical protein
MCQLWNFTEIALGLNLTNLVKNPFLEVCVLNNPHEAYFYISLYEPDMNSALRLRISLKQPEEHKFSLFWLFFIDCSAKKAKKNEGKPCKTEGKKPKLSPILRKKSLCGSCLQRILKFWANLNYWYPLSPVKS